MLQDLLDGYVVAYGWRGTVVSAVARLAPRVATLGDTKLYQTSNLNHHDDVAKNLTMSIMSQLLLSII